MNLCTFTGRLTADPETKQAGANNVVTTFRLAIDDSYRNKQTGDKVDQAVFADFEIWGTRGEVLSNHAKKGDELVIESQLKQDNWEAQDGGKRSRLLFTVRSFEFGRKKKGDANNV